MTAITTAQLQDFRTRLDTRFAQVDSIFESCMAEAITRLSEQGIEAYLDAARALGKLGRGAEAGPDWRNAFRQWLDQNLRYPREAIDLREQGPVTVRINTGPDGRVRGVELRTASRSIHLNFYSQNVFRGAQLPPFPPGTAEQQVTIDLTINYILYGR